MVLDGSTLSPCGSRGLVFRRRRRRFLLAVFGGVEFSADQAIFFEGIFREGGFSAGGGDNCCWPFWRRRCALLLAGAVCCMPSLEEVA